MKYQLADMINGTFGDVYDSLEEAEKALDSIVKELLEDQKELILSILEEWKDGCSRPTAYLDWEIDSYAIAVENGADLAEQAEASIRGFHSIEEVEEVEDE